MKHQTGTMALRLVFASVVGVLGGVQGGCWGDGQKAPPPTKRPAMPSAPDQAKARLATAQQAIRSGEKDRALVEFEKAIEINPNLVPAHLGIADLYRMDRNWAAAEPSYARAAAIEPGNFDAQFLDGLMLQELDRVQEAIQAYSRALRIRADDFRANLHISAAYYELDENSQALVYGRRAVELRPKNGEARFNLGAVYTAMERHREAVKEYQQAAELMELSPGLLMNLAEGLGKLQRYDEMKNTLEQLLKREESAAAYERLGFAEFGLRRYEEALAAFEKALTIDPDYIAALNGQGVIGMNKWLLSEMTDTISREKAIGAWRRSLQLNQNQPKIMELLTRYGMQ